jgi:HlyD family secretion protein
VWKWLLGLVLVLLLTCVGSGYYVYASGKWEQIAQFIRPDLKPTEVRLAGVRRGDLVRTVSAPGQIEPKTKVEISAQVSARIIALPFRENDRVKAGDVLVRLDARDLAALLDAAKAQLKSEEARLEGARAAFANSEAELNRRRELFASKDIPRAELDAAETEYLRAQSALRAAEHAVEIARADIRRAEKNLDNTIITSPIDGVITNLAAEVGETVVVGTLNNPGSVIMEVADLSVWLMKAKVDEANIAPIREGQKARIYINAFKDVTMTGVVEHVDLKRQVDRDGTAFFETEIVLEVPDGITLRSGLTANADIEVETFRDVLKVPSQAVVDRPVDELPAAVTDASPIIDRTRKYVSVVFTVENGKARANLVRTGVSDLTDTIILAGLSEGQRVVAGPFKSLLSLKHDQSVVELTSELNQRHSARAEARAEATNAKDETRRSQGERTPDGTRGGT